MNGNKVAFLIQSCILTTVFFSAGAVFSQTSPQTDQEKQPVKSVESGLPAGWNGIWRGLTVNQTADGKREEIPMELHVEPVGQSGARTWRILYGTGAAQTARPYEIMPAGGEPNRFVVDEKNGLLIDNQLVGNVLYSQFMVTTNLVTTRFELKGNEISVELVMFDLRAPRQSKLTGGNIEVSSYRFRSVQLGVLKKAEK